MARDDRKRGPSIITQSPQQRVGSQVFVSVPGPIPVVSLRPKTETKTGDGGSGGN